MRFSVAAAALLSAVAVKATDIPVQVGFNNSLIFHPPNITAAVGDTISFQFISKNHSVTQSTFAAPCTQMTTPTLGINSGFMNIVNSSALIPQWTISVNTTDPLWFFCAQTNPIDHCNQGMVFAVNAPAAKNFTAYQAAAKTATPGGPASNNTASDTTASGAGSSGTGAAPAATSSKASGAIKVGGSAAGVLTVAALLIGTVL